METYIKFVHLSFSKDLNEYAEKKLAKLAKKFGFISEATITYELDNRTDRENKAASIQVSLPGTASALYTVKSADTFESALDQAIDAIEKQVEYYKDKS